MFAHTGSRLNLKGLAPALPEGMILFPMAGTVGNTTEDIPISFETVTFREDEKKFTGSVAVESGTTNFLIIGNDYASFSGYEPLVTTVIEERKSIIGKALIITMPFDITFNSASRIHHQSTITADGRLATFSVYAKANNLQTVGKHLRVYTGTWQVSDIPLSTEYQRLTFSNCIMAQVNCGLGINGWSNGDSVTVYDPQLEELDHVTSFTPNTRPLGNLRYDISHLGMRDTGCIACWIYNSDSMVNNRATDGQINNQYILKAGSDTSDTHKDVMTLWIPNSTPRLFNFWSSADKSTEHLSSVQTLSEFGVGSWNHFVLQWDKNGLPSGRKKEFYINGVLQRASDTTNLPSNILTYFHVGQWNINNGMVPSTLFEQLAIHPTKGFSAEEIANWYNANAPFYDFRDTMLRW